MTAHDGGRLPSFSTDGAPELRSRLAPFVEVAKTMRERKELILNAVEHGISNSRVEGSGHEGPSAHPTGLRVPLR